MDPNSIQDPKNLQTGQKDKQIKKISYTIQIFSSPQKSESNLLLDINPKTSLKDVKNNYLSDYSNYIFYKGNMKYLNQDNPISDIADANNMITLKIKNIQTLVQNQQNQQQFAKSLQDIKIIQTLSNGESKTIIVKFSLKQQLSTLRTKLAIQNSFQFLKQGQIIANQIQQNYLVSEVVEKNVVPPIIKMVQVLTDTQIKKNFQDQIQQRKKQQEVSKQALKQLDDLAKNMTDPSQVKAKIKAIQDKLNQLNVPLQLDIDSKNQGIDAAKSVFASQAQTAKGWLQLAMKTDPNITFQSQLQNNGCILAPYYSNQYKSDVDKSAVVDFFQTKFQYIQNSQKTTKLNVAIFDKDDNSSAKTDIDSLDNYKFQGGSLSVGYGPVSASVKAGHATISHSQTINCNKSVGQHQHIKQIFYALCINHVIKFPPGSIKLKQNIVNQFQTLVDDYLTAKIGQNDTNSLQKLRLNILQKNTFLDSYGDGVTNGIYYLGGIYKNQLDYTFSAAKTASQLQNIMDNETKNSISASVSAGFGGFSASAGTQYKNQNSNSKGQQQAQQQSNSGYTCVKSHTSDPLGYIQNLVDWQSIMQGQGYHWKLLLISPKQSTTMAQLLSQINNQSIVNNARDQFVLARKEILETMTTLLFQNMTSLKFDILSTHPNINKFQCDKNSLGLIKDDIAYTSICGDTPFQQNEAHNIQAYVFKGDNMDIIMGVVAGNKKNKQIQIYNSDYAECIYYSFKDNTIYYGDCNAPFNDYKNCLINYTLNDVIKMIVDLDKKTVTFKLNGINIGYYDIPLIFLQNGLYPFFGFKNSDEILRLDKNLNHKAFDTSMNNLQE